MGLSSLNLKSRFMSIRLGSCALQALLLLALIVPLIAPNVQADSSPNSLPGALGSTDPHVPVDTSGDYEPPLSYRNGQHARSAAGYTDPSQYGGSMLLLVENNLREPINAIISGHSDPYILSDAGFRDYVRSIGFSFECFDLHLGAPMRADLGDGNGMAPERFEYREVNAWDAGRAIGSCRESVAGGNHFRAWKQYGPLSQTGAWFLAVSAEKNIAYSHKIIKNGYNHGRDLLVNASIAGGSYRNWEWKAEVEYVTGLLEKGAHGINHNISQDGRTAVITVTRIRTGDPPILERVGARIVQFKVMFVQFLSAVLTQIQLGTYLL